MKRRENGFLRDNQCCSTHEKSVLYLSYNDSKVSNTYCQGKIKYHSSKQTRKRYLRTDLYEVACHLLSLKQTKEVLPP